MINKIGIFTNYHQNTEKISHTSKLSENPTQKEVDIAVIRDTIDINRESEQVQALNNKLKMGEELTPEEEQYLKQKNPKLYEESKEIIKEREGYKKAIENAKTKEEVEEIKVNTLNKFSAELKSVENNPNIPKNEKLNIAEKISKKLAGINIEHTEFTKKAEFYKLISEENPENNDVDLKNNENSKTENDEKVLEDVKNIMPKIKEEIKCK